MTRDAIPLKAAHRWICSTAHEASPHEVKKCLMDPMGQVLVQTVTLCLFPDSTVQHTHEGCLCLLGDLDDYLGDLLGLDDLPWRFGHVCAKL